MKVSEFIEILLLITIPLAALLFVLKYLASKDMCLFCNPCCDDDYDDCCCDDEYDDCCCDERDDCCDDDYECDCGEEDCEYCNGSDEE